MSDSSIDFYPLPLLIATFPAKRAVNVRFTVLAEGDGFPSARWSTLTAARSSTGLSDSDS